MQEEEKKIAQILLRRPLSPEQKQKMLRENPVYHDCYGERIATKQGREQE